MNLKDRNYENLHSKWLLVNKLFMSQKLQQQLLRRAVSSMGLNSSTELWQNFTNIPSGRWFYPWASLWAVPVELLLAPCLETNHQAAWATGPLSHRATLPVYIKSGTKNLSSWIQAQGLQLWVCCYLSSLGPTFYLQFTFHHLLNISRHLHWTLDLPSFVSV